SIIVTLRTVNFS
ncbi:hypothetical protein CLOP_g2837, partial [Closterium sp. NIES-67]